ncbi:MAG: hypothetical protein V4555_07100 [Acidobacteriota bacterium]
MSTTPVVNLQRAEFHGDPPPLDSCAFCRSPLPGEYFRVGQRLACTTCAAKAQSLIPADSHKTFFRALLFGAVAAVIGCIAYAAFEIATGWMIGYVAIGVGWLVGWSMKKGSSGLGGRRYQIAGALLTYAAVAVAYVPIALHHNTDTDATHLGLIGSIVYYVVLFGGGLISPILSFMDSVSQGAFNLLFLFFGIRTVWRLTAQPRIAIEGPFNNTPAA